MRHFTFLPAALVVAVVSCTEALGRTGPEREGPLVHELRSMDELTLRWNVRLSVESSFPACRLDSLTLENLRCDAGILSPRLQATLVGIAGRANEELNERVTVDALHAATLVDLVVADTAGKVLDQSISRLEMITGLSPGRSMAWLDLSGAYLMRASRDRRALLAALDAASRALEIDSTLSAASYNRALALDLLTMDAQASLEWRRFVQLESRSPWTDVARQRMAVTESVRQPERPAVDAPADALRRLVTEHSFEARLFTWEVLLGGWGQAVLASDTNTGSARLEAAKVIATDVAGRYGDSSLVWAIASIEAVRGSPTERALAEAHVAFARGRDSTYANQHESAARDFQAVLSNRATSPALRDWAVLSLANAQLYMLHADQADSTASDLLLRLDPLAQPSLAGRAWWMRGVIAQRAFRDGAGLEANEKARELFERAGERDNVAATVSLLAERALRLGDDEGFATMQHALRELRRYPLGLWRHNALVIMAGHAMRAGLDRAAMAFVDEDAATAGLTRTAIIAEMRLMRARALWEQGDTIDARAEISRAEPLIDALTGGVQRFFRAEYSFTMASGPALHSGAEALRMLDSAIAFFEPASRVTRLVPAYVARARAALALGNIPAAEADLGLAAQLYEAQRDSITNLPERAAVLARGRDVFDRLAMLQLSSGDTLGALQTLERGRTSFAPVKVGTTKSPGRTQASILNLSLVADTLLSWTIDSRGVSLQRSIVPRDSLRHAIDRVRAAMELQSSEAVVRPVLAQLYDWLVRPNDSRRAADTTTLAIVSDAVLADVPFAALYDSARRQYLVERRPVRWAPTLADAQSPPPRTSGARALIVSSPALDTRVFPALPGLPAAERESRSVSSSWTKPVLLDGLHADSASVTTALESAEHFHFAGHAIFDDARPHRSRLAMMPRGIDAATIAKLDLRRLRLAVLSACETVRAPERHGAGFSGIAEAFLAAGAGGVVGTLWPVDDAHTGRFIDAFYGAYRAHGDAAAALREAQLQMMRSAGAPARPSAWAGFRLAGR